MKVLTGSVVMLLVLFQFMVGQIPQTMSYQGILTDNQGQVVSDGNYQMTFKIYDQKTEGTSLWEESLDVTIAGGVFNVVLGKNNPLTINFTEPYWLGITIFPGNELEPRIELTASPYSLNAKQVKGTNIFPSEGNVGIGTANPVYPFEVENNITITGSDLEGGQLTLLDSDREGGWEIDNFGESGKEEIRVFRDKGFNDQLSVMHIKSNGNIGIATADPQEKFEVNGIISSLEGGFKFPDGSLQTTAATGGNGDGGDITAVTAGTGLTGGGETGDVVLNVGAGNGLAASENEIGLDEAYTDARYVNENQANSVSASMLTDNSVESSKVADNSLTAADLNVNVVSSINGVTNDGGNIDLVEGSNITITPNDDNNTITIAATVSEIGNTLDQAYDQGGPGAGRTINADAGAVNIDGAGGIRVNGWVGIGTTAPEYPLHVKGWYKLEGSDFLMAEPSRGDGGRALVHTGSGSGNDDRMVLNFAGDFEEGVNIQGSKLVVEGQVGVGI